jgi:hypothetical protein
LQDDALEIYDGQTNTLLNPLISLVGDNSLLTEGNIRLGMELFGPNQNVEVEFDNVKVYNRCP